MAIPAGKRPLLQVVRSLGLSGWLPKGDRELLPQAEHLAKFFRQRDINIVIDVGANAGQFATFLRNLVGYTGWIFSLEPNPDILPALTQRMGSDRYWQLYPMALGREAGTLPLRVTRSSEFSSFRAVNDQCARWFEASGELVREVMVPVRTLRSVLDEVSHRVAEPSIYLKLDTQGFDYEILKGSADALERLAGLQTELAFQLLYDGGTAWRTVVDFLEGHGFGLNSLWPVSVRNGVLVEADGMFVRPHGA